MDAANKTINPTNDGLSSGRTSKLASSAFLRRDCSASSQDIAAKKTANSPSCPAANRSSLSTSTTRAAERWRNPSEVLSRHVVGNRCVVETARRVQKRGGGRGVTKDAREGVLHVRKDVRETLGTLN